MVRHTTEIFVIDWPSKNLCSYKNICNSLKFVGDYYLSSYLFFASFSILTQVVLHE